MDITDKIKKENYGNWKYKPETVIQLRDWLSANTNVVVDGLTQAEMVYLIRNGYTENAICTCGKPIEYKHSRYHKYCSAKCAANNPKTLERRTETVKDKYGCENVFQSEEVKLKAQLTNMERYGDENPFRTGSDAFKTAMLEKHGVSHAMAIDGAYEKARETCLERYGVEFYSQTDGYWDMVAQNNLEKYGVDHPIKLDGVRGEIRRGIYDKTYDKLLDMCTDIVPTFSKEEYIGCGYEIDYEWKCTKCENTFNHWYNNGLIPNCPNCSPKSKFEVEIYDLIKEIHPDALRNSRSIIENQELDTYVPSLKIAVECDGIYWHSEVHGGIGKRYHLNKTKACREKGIRLIHIFEDEWRLKRDIVTNRLRHIFGADCNKIYARKCKVRKIPNNVKAEFLSEYHIQGDDRSSIRYGLFHVDVLVAVMTFGTQRFGTQRFGTGGGYELIRYATASGVTVVGGAGKLLKAFETEYSPELVKTYADLRWSDGNMYKQLGFTHTHDSSPCYFYMKRHDVRINRINFQKHKLAEKLPIFDPALSEWENMKANGYDRIWDCGNMVFEKTY